MTKITETHSVALDCGPIYDIFHCRGQYIGMVGPYYSRTNFDRTRITVDGIPAEWFMLPSSRQFTMSLLVRIPQPVLSKNAWYLRVVTTNKPVIEHVVHKSDETGGRLCMSTMAKHDAPYIGEWIEHHKKMGFEHFYIYNQDTKGALHRAIEPYGDCVTEIRWMGEYGFDTSFHEPFLRRDSHLYTQPPQMMHAILKHGSGWDWMACMDADEFLVPSESMGILELLTHAEGGNLAEVPYSRIVSLVLQGKWFGTNNHRAAVLKDVRRAYVRCERGHTCGTKCIVQPHAVTGCAIHYFDVYGSSAIVPDNLMRFNHYRAISQFKVRIGELHNRHYSNETTDERILQYL